jgi:hypothetical protein
VARVASIAVAGYYKTPTHLLNGIASLIRVENESSYAVFDPCAGDGEAIVELAKAWWPEEKTRRNAQIYANEMEKTRFDALKDRKGKDGLGYRWPEVTHGDAFALDWDDAKVSIVFLNPPYDFDKEHGRLEEKFLIRFVDMIRFGGALLFLVPYYALAKSAGTIACHFSQVHCVRFPDPDFDVFKQVVLVGKKHEPLLDPDPEIRAKVLQWSADASTIQSDWSEPFFDVYAHDKDGISGLKMLPLDIDGMLRRAKPWHSTDRGGKLQPIVGVVPDKPAHEGLDRVFPVALPLKPAYLASGIAAGVFNGELIRPDDPESTLPDILLKGVFRKDFVHVPSEDKRNKDGEKTSETHVQQPALVITILDLRTKKYSELVSSVDTTGEMDPAKMSVGDLLQHYGKSMMTSMLKSCHVIHDPAKDEAIEIPSIARPLYTAQAHAVMAALKVLGGVDMPLRKRRGQACFILGEVGVGKTVVALATSVAMGAKRTLVMCPPHLVPEWQEQVQIWFPEHRSIVLDDVRDVHALAESTDKRPTIAIFSRETAKLSHAWAGIGPRSAMVRGEKLEIPARCPKCNSVLEMGPDTLAAKRQTCTNRKRRALNVAAKLARKLGFILAPAAPMSQHVVQVIDSHVLRRAVAKWAHVPSDQAKAQKCNEEIAQAWEQLGESGRLEAFAAELFRLVQRLGNSEHVIKFGEALLLLFVAIGSEQGFRSGARAMYVAGNDDTSGYYTGAEKRKLALKLLLCCEKENRDALAAELRDSLKTNYSHERDSLFSLWGRFDSVAESLDAKRPIADPEFKHRNEDGWGDHSWSELSGAVRALETLSGLALWGESEPCGERLYQAIPEPRRVALAPYIAKRLPRLFDCVIFDEFHELSNSIDSAQSAAMMRLAQLGAPVLALTGSAMNGYAKSLFAGQWALDPEFRREFERNQEGKFVQRYGYIKIKVEMRDSNGKSVSFGAVSDRVERTEREAGSAPGVLPLFVLQYLLKKAVVIHKDDLAIDLPPCHHIVEHVSAGLTLQGNYDALAHTLKKQIKRDAFGPLAGKLFGQVSELPSYLDRATSDMGNCSDGWWRIRYPEDCEGGLVAEQEPFERETILPKEQWMLDKVRDELFEGRNVLIFGYHVIVLPRLRRLIQEQLGEPCALLLATPDKSIKTTRVGKPLANGEGPIGAPGTDKRKPWIAQEIIGRGVRVMVVNSTAVQTGLNNLVHFNSIIWMENPACSPIGFRQANGRIFRPGQEKETRIFFTVYIDTAQAAAHSLLMLKVGVSEGTDGLDARGAMAAAGVGEQATMSAFGVGKQLFSMMEDERSRLPRPAEKRPEESTSVLSEPPRLVMTNEEPIFDVAILHQNRAKENQLKLF